MKKKSNPRREFLKKSVLGGISLAAVPLLGKASFRELNSREADCNPATLDYYGEGPFYTINAPDLVGNVLAAETEVGTRLTISGTVTNLDCSEIIPNTEIDLWHADDAGAYDNGGYNLRGKIYSDSNGNYSFETILPGKYLNGSAYRPSHIHVKVTPPGSPTLTTQIYFEGDTDIPADAAASINSGTYDASNRIVSLTTNADGSLQGTWDIAVEGDGISAIESLHTERGMIYSLSPNPFVDKLTIYFGLFRDAKVSIQIMDVNGMVVDQLSQGSLKSGKHTVVWEAPSQLSVGIYWIVLTVNEMQVHSEKVMRQSFSVYE